ncbi:DUF423 domain-containing protein [Psychromonas sp. RZ22]|uniref:DUF423 domain-containing protein n=1 Tax=Psychromonas algarum TaxID=2555643 RepID=UPI001067F2AC|nr:DUF423 domain-containing protein [Psychromonas sp. RZ22]TEW55984.1 DUF423 domain-containing protein [Psychromonas sp. RZ22]
MPSITLSNQTRFFIAVAAFLGASAVMFGAYASHGLSAWASAARISQVQLAAQYQLFHAISLLIVSLLNSVFVGKSISRTLISFSLWCFTLGILCFSGSLYYLVFAGTKLLVLITPLGGLLLICAWLCLGFAMLFKQK